VAASHCVPGSNPNSLNESKPPRIGRTSGFVKTAWEPRTSVFLVWREYLCFFLKRDWRGLGLYSKGILKNKEYSYVQKLLKEDQTATLRNKKGNKKDQTKSKN
jgi:hypothetical protein